MMKFGSSLIPAMVIAVLALVLLAVPSAAQISIVVGQSSGQKATKDEVRNFFAGSNLSWDNGAKVQIVDQPETETGKKFYESFVGKSTMQIRTQWTKLVLSGQATAPVKCADDNAVKKALAGNPNAIGFIATKDLDGSVKELLRIE